MLGLIGGLIRLCVKIAVLCAGTGLIIAHANLSDLDDFKADVKRQMLEVAGRQLSFDGDIDFEIGFPPRIIARGVRIENAPWGSRKDMLKADTLIAEVDFLPLLVGDVAAPRLRLVGVDILVETNEDGVNNWDDLNEFETAAGGFSASPDVPVFGSVFGGGGVGVSGGTLTVLNGATEASSTITLPGLPVIVGGGGGSVPCL